MTENDSQALHRIDTHEAVCTERYTQIFQSLESIRKDIQDLKVDRKASETMLREEMHGADDAIWKEVKVNREDISKINLSIAKMFGAVTLASFLGAALLQLLSGVFVK